MYCLYVFPSWAHRYERWTLRGAGPFEDQGRSQIHHGSPGGLCPEWEPTGGTWPASWGNLCVLTCKQDGFTFTEPFDMWGGQILTNVC